MKHIHQLRRGAALCLAAVLLMSVTALAAEPDKSRTEARREDLNILYDTLKAKHPDLFANTPEADFLTRKAEIEGRLETVSDVEFLLDLQSLTALAEDSHTTLSLGNLSEGMHFYPMALTWRDGHWYLTAAAAERRALLGREVTAINGRSMDAVVTAFGQFLSADNLVKLRREFRQGCNVADFYEYLGLAKVGKPLVLTFSDGVTLGLNAVEAAAMSTADIAQLQPSAAAATAYDRSRAYWSRALDNSTYYIQYNTCREDPELPMKTFAAQVWADLDTGAYDRVLIDLRNNGGGSDSVIWPLLRVLRGAINNGTEVVGLIGETTFSSAIINAVELQEMGIPLVGEETSGSVDHFGSVSGFELPNSKLRLGVSSKYIDLGTLLDADAGRGVEPLVPDVEVPQTMADTLAGKDTAVEWLLAHREPLAQKEFPNAPLTRGRFLGQLYGTLNEPNASWDAPPFTDLLGVEWYLHPLNWAYQAGVLRGTGDGGASAARAISWQEAAVFLVRASNAQGLTPKTVRTTPLPATLAADAWDLDALEQAWAWGLLPEAADFTKAPTRSQGEAMAAALAGI